MTDEQKAAFIMAQAAVLNAEITGMIAANYEQMQKDSSLRYGEEDFKAAVNRSPCHYNTAITFFRS